MDRHAVFAMVICEMHFPASRSLKEKRRIVKSFTERLRSRFQISVAETAYHDLHQRAQVALALVDSRPSHLEQVIEQMRRTADRYHEASVVRWEVDFLEAEL